MGGFVGYLNENGILNQDEDILKQMSDKIIHRGICEPVYNESRNLVIFSDLPSNTSAEEILRGYEEHGEAIAAKLRGPFAFVIYNTETRELYGARDHFGIKPFYYYVGAGSSRPQTQTDVNQGQENPASTFMFGSEIKSFLPHPDFKKELSKDILKLYLIFQYSPLEQTFFKNVFKLQQGCYFTYKNHELKVTRYFDIEYNTDKIGNKSFDEYVDLLEKTLIDSIGYYTQTPAAAAAPPFERGQGIDKAEAGGFLSGGVDSSFLASAAKPSKTFSVGFAQDGFDESMYAKELSDILKIENHKKIVSGDEFFDILPIVQYHSDEPHANLSSVPLYYLSKMAKEHVKIALSGEGSDEFFAGYLTFGKSEFVKFYEKLPFGFRKLVRKIIKPLPNFRGKATIMQCGQKVEDYYIGQAFITNDAEANGILTEKYKSDISYKDVTAPYFAKAKGRSDLIKKLYLDMFLWMPSDILLKADKMSAAHSLEVRMPILDTAVFEIASKIPAEYLVKNKITKYIFRKVADKYIPEEWAKRKKLGFPVPFSLWLREQKYYDILKNLFSEDFTSEFFIQDKILAMLDEHFNKIKNNGRKLYTVYSFLVWYKVYFIVGRDDPGAPSEVDHE